MNVNGTTKVDAATTVSIPPGVFIANAQQVFSWTKRGSARVILYKCFWIDVWSYIDGFYVLFFPPFKMYKKSLVFSKMYWSYRNNNLAHKPRHKLHYRHFTFIAEIDRCDLDNSQKLFENFWHKLRGKCSLKVLHLPFSYFHIFTIFSLFR